MLISEIINHYTAPEISVRRKGNTIWIDTFYIPPPMRGIGEGRRQYLEWESKLPKTIKYLKLLAVEGGAGDSSPFWKKMGFSFVYQPDTDLDFEVPTEMIKGINGHKTPAPIPYIVEDE